MCWNVWGEANYLFFGESTLLSAFIWVMSPWYMPLMMALAGASARLSLKRRNTKEFMKERFFKLFVPLLLGIIFVVEPITYFADRFHNDYSGGYFEHYKIFFSRYTDLSGYDGGFTPGHLWFLLYLFVISIISLLIIKIPKFDMIHKKTGLPLFILTGLLPFIVSSVLSFGGKSVASYFVFYLLGYCFISDDEFVQQKIVKYRWIYFVIFIAAVSFNVYAGLSSLSGVLVNAVYFSAAWFGILTISGFSVNGFNCCNKLTRYLSKISFNFYIFHYIWLTVFQFYIARSTSSFLVLLLVPMLLSYIATFVTCEIFRVLRNAKKTYLKTKSAY